MSKAAPGQIQPVVLCGGSGKRLWPASRPEKPKPFLDLLGDRTLFQQALDRVEDRSLFAQPLVVAGAAHTRWIGEQAGAHSLIVEPCARNTAPAIALAAARLEPDTIMLVCPSDHYIADSTAFADAARKAATLAAEGWFVSLGVEPDRPDTGYGYIERGASLGEGHEVRRFVEKPDAERAASYLAQGGFLWNSGIFAFAAGRLLEELAVFRPAMIEKVRLAVGNGELRDGAFHPTHESFADIADESIDYALMENTGRAAVVSARMGWSDIGSWQALMDAHGAFPGSHSAELVDCDNVMVRSDGPRVSAIGLENVIIVVDGDDVLVVARNAAQQVSKLKGAKGT